MLGKISFQMDGVPLAKGRARAVARMVKQGGAWKAIAQLITPKETRKAEEVVAKAATIARGNRQPFAGPVKLTFIAVFPIAASWPKWLREKAATTLVYHTGKPDLDNLVKLATDGMNAIVYQDDSQIAEVVARKRYALRAQSIVIVEELGGDASPVLTPADKRRAGKAAPTPPPPPQTPRLL